MTKKQLILTIDEDLIDNAKKHIPNISAFVEECLKNYLGVGIGLVETSKMQDLVMTISKSQLELYLMNERGNIEEAKKEAEQEEIRLAWMRLYAEYRDQRTINQDYLKHASEVLGVDQEELSDIVTVCFAYRHNGTVDVTSWEDVYGAYGYGD